MKSTIKLLGIILMVTVLSCNKNDNDTIVVPDSVEETPQTEETPQKEEEAIPTLGEIAPQTGPKATIVTINGTNFGTDESRVNVLFNETEAEILLVTSTRITAKVPAGAYTGIVKLVIGSTELTGPEFVYLLSETSITTYAGSFAGDADGIGTSAQFTLPTGTCVDSLGNLYVADSGIHRIRKISPTGEVTTFAGSTKGFADGLGTSAQFDAPYALAIDKMGTIYVADANNHKIRKITAEGMVSTLAGSTIGFTDGVGPTAHFRFPRGIAVDNEGNIHVADTGNRRVREITADGTVSTPNYDSFNSPVGIAVDTNNNIYVADSNSHTISKFDSSGVLFHLAGGDKGYEDGPVGAAQFSHPRGLAVDLEGNVFIADEGNHKIRKIDLDGTVSTTAGDLEGSRDGSTSAAQFNFPYGLTVDAEGNIYVADTSNHTIRKIIID